MQADAMEEYFDKLWKEMVDGGGLNNGTKDGSNGGGGAGTDSVGEDSAMPSGTSTPMFKPPGAKIKLNLSSLGAGRKKKVERSPSASEESEVEANDDGDEDDEDDDY